jgi:hypothetical protein
MAGNSTHPGRSVTSKLSAILLVLCDGGEHTLTEIACSTNLPTSTAHRLILQMLAWRLIERSEDRSYRMGFPLRMVANDYSTPEAGVYAHTVMRALPVLNELSTATRCPARIGTLCGSDVFTLQLPPNMPTDRVHAEGFLHAVTPSHRRMRPPRAKRCSPSLRLASSTTSSRPGCRRTQGAPSPHPRSSAGIYR